MQAAKYLNAGVQEQIRAEPKWHQAHIIGWSQSHATPLRPDWDLVRLAVLERALQAKFFGSAAAVRPDDDDDSSPVSVVVDPHADKRAAARQRLMATAGKTLIFCDTDLFWAVNNMNEQHRWAGCNTHGKILQKVRDAAMMTK